MRQAAHLEEHRRLVSLIDNKRVRRLRGVLVAQAPADGERERGNGILSQEPAANIHLVGALVAVVAVAIVPEPVPVIVHRAEAAIAPRRFVRGRAAPDIVINIIGHALRAVHQANALAAFVAEPAGENYLAEMTLPHSISPPPASLPKTGTGCRTGRSAYTCGRPPPFCGPRKCYGRRASRHKRPCPPGTPIPWPTHASGSARRWTLRPRPYSPSSLRMSV